MHWAARALFRLVAGVMGLALLAPVALDVALHLDSSMPVVLRDEMGNGIECRETCAWVVSPDYLVEMALLATTGLLVLAASVVGHPRLLRVAAWSAIVAAAGITALDLWERARIPDAYEPALFPHVLLPMAFGGLVALLLRASVRAPRRAQA